MPKWSNSSSTVGHLVFALGQWSAIEAYHIPCTLGRNAQNYVKIQKVENKIVKCYPSQNVHKINMID